MKKFFAGLLTAALALVFASCTHSGESSPSAGALNTFNTEAAALSGWKGRYAQLLSDGRRNCRCGSSFGY